MTTTLSFTTIKPSDSSLSVCFPQRSKEGEAEKPSLYATFFLPAQIESIANDEIKSFCIRAYSEAVKQTGDKARKEGLSEFHMPALSELFVKTGKREFTITRKGITDWLESFALSIISSAISAKSSLHIDSPKVVKKALKYAELIQSLTSREIMSQDDIDSCLRVVELIVSSGKDHTYTDNIIQGIAKMQAKRTAKDNGADDEEDDDGLDF